MVPLRHGTACNSLCWDVKCELPLELTVLRDRPGNYFACQDYEELVVDFLAWLTHEWPVASHPQMRLLEMVARSPWQHGTAYSWIVPDEALRGRRPSALG